MMTRSDAPDTVLVEAMAAALGHRGPDGSGSYLRDNVAMAHRRLAIIDLETGDQPISQASGPTIIANAEIYNYVELRAALNGAKFTTESDCEPALHYYGRDDIDFAAALRGMYAIAMHDPAQGRLLLARDPFGIKPLYYVQREDGVAFASEPQALLAAGLAERGIADRPRNELLQLQFTTGSETIFPNIKRVLPGETLVISNGRIVDRRRIEAVPPGGPADWSEDEALRRLDVALRDSVEIHQRSDVPYGMFLSGGIDSSALLVLMAELNERPVQAYTAGFAGVEIDERAHAKAVAAKVGADHVETEVSENDFWELLPEIAAVVDDPTADYAIVPTYKLAREAAKDLKVVLTGEGGDEMFAGYGRYRSLLRPWWRGGRVMRARGILDGRKVLRSDITGWRDGIVQAEATAASEGRTRLQVGQLVDGADWLPNDLLIKLDRCLMAHGMEGRTPFLDRAVADVAFRLPDALKVRDGVGKYLLRKWLEARLPEAQPFSRKRGFTVPVGLWMESKDRLLGSLVAKQPAIDEICEPHRVEALFRERGKRAALAAWILLFYALWYRANIAGVSPSGDVFETLATPI